jgi:hypothetical protein
MPSIQKNKPEPRYRPLGMIIAIIATGFLYGIVPLVPVGMSALITLEGHHLAGADLPFSALDVLAGVMILVVCVMAWIGRPRWVRWVLILSVWLATAYDFERLYQNAQPQPIIGTTSGSFTQFAQSAVPCVVILLVAVPLYITWYMNRAPVRNFYRRD